MKASIWRRIPREKWRLYLVTVGISAAYLALLHFSEARSLEKVAKVWAFIVLTPLIALAAHILPEKTQKVFWAVVWVAWLVSAAVLLFLLS